ncbi:outer membrane beta-barrel protein [Marivirga sp.]|uniref:outer membrane beta-barrel protein n=1 Tax=Marivirga sp. TaxID=2018662 RepID=UPI0025F8DAA7|nr:outer membrane beta-barrel protein [Marivirga sp.]
MKRALLISILLMLGAELFAQSFYSNRINRRWMATGGLGYARSLGDLTNPGSYFDTKLNIVGGLQYRFTNRVSAGVNLMAFQLSGDDQDIDPELNTRSRGLSFVSNNLELSATASVSLFPMANRFTQRKTINPYLIAGVGVLLFDPRAEVPEFLRDEAGDTLMAVPRAGEMVSLRQYQTERPNSYGRFAFVIPVGVGVRVKVTDFIDLTAQVSNRITFTDYLDDVSGRGYPDRALFDLNNPEDVTALALSDPTGRGEIRGNPENNDHYFIVNVRAEFYIQGEFLNKIFGVGGKRYNIRPQRGRGGLFNFGNRR